MSLKKKLNYLKRQKLQKSIVLLLGILISSCGKIPPKPSIDLCIHDQPRKIVYCNNNTTGNEYDLPISQTDKYLMLSPDDYQSLLIYLQKLEDRLKRSNSRKKLFK